MSVFLISVRFITGDAHVQFESTDQPIKCDRELVTSGCCPLRVHPIFWKWLHVDMYI